MIAKRFFPVICTGAVCLLMPSIIYAQLEGGNAPQKKKEEKKKVVDKEKTNLDEDQQAAFVILKKKLTKVYGYEGEIPETAILNLQEDVWKVLNGTYKPERARSNKLASELVVILKKELMSDEDASELVSLTAEILGMSEMSAEMIEVYEVDIKKVFARSRLAEPERQKQTADLVDLVKTAKKNEDKIKEREARKKKEEERLAAEEKKKKDKEAKKKSGKSSKGGRGGSPG